MTSGGVKLSLQVLSTVQRFYSLGRCLCFFFLFSFLILSFLSLSLSFSLYLYWCWFFPSICGCTVRWNAGIYPVTGALQRLAIASYDVIVRGFFYFGGRLFLVTFILSIFIFCTCLLVFFLFLGSFVFFYRSESPLALLAIFLFLYGLGKNFFSRHYHPNIRRFPVPPEVVTRQSII